MQQAMGYLDTNGRIHKTKSEAGLHSLAAMIDSNNGYLNLAGAEALVKSLGKNPEVLAWIVSQYTMAEF